MTEPSFEEQLDKFRRQSERRGEELLEIAAQLPAAVSRRALFHAMAADLRSAPGKADVFRARAAERCGSAPRGVHADPLPVSPVRR